jgi:hypothetical protein
MTDERDDATDLYRYYDAGDRLLYVGISFHAVVRAAQHRSEKPWWSDVRRMEVEHLQTRREALQAEAVAIRTERPIHNVIGNAGRRHDTRRSGTAPMSPWMCMRCGRGCGQRLKDAYIQIDSFNSWQVVCGRCDDNPSPSYWIDASAIADADAIQQWTVHLAKKIWFEWRSWYTLIETHCNVPFAKQHAHEAMERVLDQRHINRRHEAATA